MNYGIIIFFLFLTSTILGQLITNFLISNYKKHKKSNSERCPIVVVERDYDSFAYVDNEMTLWAEGKDNKDALINLFLSIPDLANYRIVYKDEKKE